MPDDAREPDPAVSPDVRDADPALVRWVRRTVLLVAALNLAYFFVEVVVALAIGSVALLADSVDFLEDTAVNLLIAISLGFSMHARARMGRVMAVIICVPALFALVQAIRKISEPDAPDATMLVVTAVGAALVNLLCAWLLARHRDHVGSLTTAAFLAARNDVVANLLVIVVGLVTMVWVSGWPDIAAGLVIAAINLSAAKEVWEVAGEEHLAARALAGDLDDD